MSIVSLFQIILVDLNLNIIFLSIGINVKNFYHVTLHQAFLEHGIPESPETVVELMRKVWTIQELLFMIIFSCFNHEW
jgi:hypothetical protein